MAASTSKETTSAFDTLDDTVGRIRDLNETLVQLAKQQGRVSLDIYEKALQSLIDFEKAAASTTQFDWVSALANTHAKFVQDITGSYLRLANEALK
jgi:hypothetical protein